MADQDLHTVAFPTLDDVQVATLAKFGTRRALRDGEHLFKAGDRDVQILRRRARRGGDRGAFERRDEDGRLA